jgi:hypothetical protein
VVSHYPPDWGEEEKEWNYQNLVTAVERNYSTGTLTKRRGR